MAPVTRYYSSPAVDNTIGVPGGISSSATSVYCTTSPANYPAGYPFTLVMDEGTASEELVSVTSGSGTSVLPWQIIRGFDSTAATSHGQGAQIGHRMSAFDLTTSRLHESLDNTTGAQPHGLPLTAWQVGSMSIINATELSNSTTNTVTWTGIPQTYSHLLVVVSAKCTYTSALFADIKAVVNADTSSVYSLLELQAASGTPTAPASSSAFAQAGWNWFMTIAASQAGAATNIGAGFAFLPNYSGTVHDKSFQSVSGYGSGTIANAIASLRFGWYHPATSAAVTSLSLSVANGFYTSGALFSLYGCV